MALAFSFLAHTKSVFSASNHPNFLFPPPIVFPIWSPRNHHHGHPKFTNFHLRYPTLAMSSFQPPDPPKFKGQPVFPDIDFQHGLDQNSEGFRRNHDQDAVAVVTGASRGIGLQMVKSLIERTKGSIVACCRNPDGATLLNKFTTTLSPSQRARIAIQLLDLENEDSIQDASAMIHQKFNRVDLLVHVAGILGDGKTTPGPERSLLSIDRNWLEKTLAVNLISPLMLTKHLSPLMRTTGQPTRSKSVVVHLSARVGSISDNQLGGWYSYRISKSALNQASRTMALEFRRNGIWVVSLHPGTTDTELSKPFQPRVDPKRLFPVQFTVKKLLDVVDSLQDQHTGGFYDWAGKALPF